MKTEYPKPLSLSREILFILLVVLLFGATFSAKGQVPVWYQAGYYNPHYNGPSFSITKNYHAVYNSSTPFASLETYRFKILIDLQGNITGRAHYQVRKYYFIDNHSRTTESGRFFDIRGNFVRAPSNQNGIIVSRIVVRMPHGGRLTADIASAPPIYDINSQAIHWGYIYSYRAEMAMRATLKMPGIKPKKLRTGGSGFIGIMNSGALYLFPDQASDYIWGF